MSTQSPLEEQFRTLLQFAIILQFKPKTEQNFLEQNTGMIIILPTICITEGITT